MSRSVGRQEDGLRVNAEMIGQGYVWASTRVLFKYPERCQQLERGGEAEAMRGAMKP